MSKFTLSIHHRVVISSDSIFVLTITYPPSLFHQVFVRVSHSPAPATPPLPPLLSNTTTRFSSPTFPHSAHSRDLTRPIYLPAVPRWSPVIVRSDISKRLLTHYSWEIFPGTCCVFFSMPHKWREFIIRGFYLVRRSLNANGFFIFSLLFHSFSLVMVCGRRSNGARYRRHCPGR